MKIYSPKNTILRIDDVWMAISIDDDGTEGVCAVQVNGTWYPLIAADEKRLPFVLDNAKAIAKRDHRLVEVIRLTTRKSVERFDGRQ